MAVRWFPLWSRAVASTVLAFGVLLFVGAANEAAPVQYEIIPWKDRELHLVKASGDRCAFRLAYTVPPRTVGEQHQNSGAIVTINAGYWQADYTPTDLLIVDGRQKHAFNAKARFDGFFGVNDGRFVFRDLSKQPYKESEKWEQALRCGPVAVRDGRLVRHRSISSHRRTVIGEDRFGRFFALVSGTAWMSYDEIAEVCVREPVSARFAFHLDGGASTGLSVSFDQTNAYVPSAPVGSHLQIFKK